MSNKHIALLIFVLIIIFWGGFTLLQMDDELSPDVKVLLETRTPPAQSYAYFYLLGFDAPAGMDPLDVGKQRFQDLQELSLKNAASKPIPTEKIAMPDNTVFCDLREEQCLSGLFRNRQLETYLHQHSELLSRFKTLMWLDDYYTLQEPLILDAGMISPEYLISANRLLLLEAVLLTQKKDTKAAIELLKNNLNGIRKQLATTDTDLLKATYASLIHNNIAMLAVIIHRFEPTTLLLIDPLSPDERDITRSAVRGMIATHALLKLYTHMEHRDASQNAINRILVKPNLSINQLYPDINHQIQLSRMTPEEFYQYIASTENTPPEIPQSLLRNYLGAQIRDIGFTNFRLSISSLFASDDFIRLFNATMAENHPDIKHTLNASFLPQSGNIHTDRQQKTTCLQRKDVEPRCLRYSF